MSGVLMNGIQWEHCNECGGWVDIHALVYEQSSADNPYGRDLCRPCADAS